MTDDRFGDPVNDDARPIPAARTPKPSLWQRIREWLIGWRDEE